MAFADHFSSRSGDYARFRPHYPGRLFEVLARLPERRCLAWDCATGSGQAARGLQPHFDWVVATDGSLAQIAQAAAVPRLLLIRSLAEASALTGGSVDLVTVAQALHWFDVDRFWPEVRRVLAPGGVVAVWCLELARITPAVDRLVERFYSETVGSYWPPQRRHVETGYRHLSFPFTRLEAPSFEAVSAWDLDGLLGYISTWSATVRYRDAVGEDPLPRLAADLGVAWGERGRVRPVVWPLRLLTGKLE